MKVTRLDIYLFRCSQVLAALLLPAAYLLAGLFLLVSYLLVATAFSLVGLLLVPLLMALFVFDFLGDFSKRRTADPLGKYIDIIFFLPEACWDFLKGLSRKALFFPRALFRHLDE